MQIGCDSRVIRKKQAHGIRKTIPIWPAIGEALLYVFWRGYPVALPLDGYGLEGVSPANAGCQ